MTQTESTVTLRVVGDPPSVAPGVITTPPTGGQPLPATGNATDPGWTSLGLVVLATVGWCAARKWWLAITATLLLACCCTTPVTTYAAPLLPGEAIKISQWDVDPVPETFMGNGYYGGFLGDSFRNSREFVEVGSNKDLIAYYHLGTGEYITNTTLTLHSWALSKLADGTYRATKLKPMLGGNLWDEQNKANIKSEFRFPPSTSGWYVYQYVSSAFYTDVSGKHPVASKLGVIGATHTATKLTINAPNLLLFGQQAAASAITTPQDSTDTITWTPQANLGLAATANHRVTLATPTAGLLNQSMQTAGSSERLVVKATGVNGHQLTTTKAVTVGGLKALKTSFDALPATGLRHTTTGLANAQLPAGEWHYQWELADTHQDADGQLQLIANSEQPLTGAENAQGNTQALSDQTVAFTIAKTSPLMQRLSDPAMQNTPKAIRLKLTNAQGQQLTTNFALLAVAPTTATLRLVSVPTLFAWQFSSLELYDHLAKTVSGIGELEIDDPRQTPGWELTAHLNSDQPFPFSLQLEDVAGSLVPNTKSPTVVASGGGEGLVVTAPEATLTPTGSTFAREYTATLTWMLTSTVAGPTL